MGLYDNVGVKNETEYRTGCFLKLTPGRAVLLASADLQKPESSAGVNQRAASDWSVVIISTLPLSLTWSRGEYLRVVGILEMVE